MSELVTPHGENRHAPAPADLNRAMQQGGIPVVHAGKIVLPDTFPGVACPSCNTSLQPGDLCTLVPIGPGADPEARRAARLNVRFNVASLIVCWPCVSGEEPIAKPTTDLERSEGDPAPTT